MITRQDNWNTVEYRCLTTDPEPHIATDPNLKNGSLLVKLNPETGEVTAFMYNAETDTWKEMK